MKSWFSTAVCLALAGCATPGSLRQDPPIFTLTTAHPVAAVVSCIVEKWGGAEHLPIIMNVLPLPNEGSSVSIMGANMNTLLLVDVRKAGGGAQLEAFRYGLMLDPYIADVKACSP